MKTVIETKEAIAIAMEALMKIGRAENKGSVLEFVVDETRKRAFEVENKKKN